MVRHRVKQERPTRAREASVKHTATAVDQPDPGPRVFHVTVTDRGRLVLPAEARETLKIRDGDRVSLTLEDDGSLVLQTRDVAIRRLRGMFKHLAKPGRLASDELIAERRREARRDDQKFREWVAYRRKLKK